jgi:hypothetical protein
MAFILATFIAVASLLFYDAITTDFTSPTPRSFRFTLRGLLLAVTVTAVLFGLAAATSVR